MSYARSRARGGFALSPYTLKEYFKWSTCAQSSYALNATYNTFYTGSKESMYDTVTPNFKSLQRRGFTTFTDMSYMKQESTIVTTGGCELESASNTVTCSGIPRKFAIRYDDAFFANRIAPTLGDPLPVYSAISSSDVAELQKEVSTRCQARRGMSDSNLYESVAEIRQTLGLIKRPLDSLNRLLSRASSVRGRVGAASDAWLTYRYGVMPIVRDIGAVIDGLGKKVGEVRKTTRTQGSLSRYSYETSVKTWSPPNTFTLNFGIQKTDEVLVRAMSLDEYVVDLYENIGFTTKGLVTLPWELIPYSFVADWFVNFGDYLQALVPLPGVKQLGACLTTRRIMTNIWTPSNLSRVNYNVLSQPSGQCLSRLTTKTRTALLAPSLVVKSDFKFDDATRMADAVSLLIQRMNRIFAARR